MTSDLRVDTVVIADRLPNGFPMNKPQLSTAEGESLRKLMSSLPHSSVQPPEDRAVCVSLKVGPIRQQRVYDRAAPPLALREMFVLLDSISFETWFPELEPDPDFIRPIRDVWSMAHGPKGRLLALRQEDKQATIWNVDTGDLLANIAEPSLSKCNAGFLPECFAPDGSVLAVPFPGGAIVVELQASDRPRRVRMPSPEGIASLAVSSDLRRLVFGGAASVQIVDIITGQLVTRLPVHGDVAALSPDGKTLATCDGRTLRLWDPEDARLRCTLPQEMGSWLLAFHPNSKIFALASVNVPGAVGILQAVDGKQKAALRIESVPPHFHPSCHSLHFSRDGKWLALGTYGNSVCLWDVATWRQVADLRPARNSQSLRPTCIVFSPDGEYVYAAGWDMPILRWPLKPVREHIRTMAAIERHYTTQATK